MYELKKKIGKVFTSKFVGTGPSSYEKRIYRAAVSQRLSNTVLDRPDQIRGPTNFVSDGTGGCLVCGKSDCSLLSAARVKKARGCVATPPDALLFLST